ncbi:nicotinate-nucleotide--dimethylbenzimidazole phosphoribosyltransferase [Streptomyces lunalinharesii]|uniref:Nicotinate-nucleotide--dimethylbenzimidazole phosphoribosyltransferase n=1 Tax=Streptomyces lunalinharesii TaxID=333384 RepID=A0ABN3S233_9ACTN
MTDTGQVPGQGQPENAGGHHGQPQAVPSPADPGTAQHPEYAYLGPAEGSVEDDDLLMPGAQGAWSEHGVQQAQPPTPPQAVPAQQTAPFEPPVVPEQVPAAVGDHESGGRDSGSVDLGAVRVPQPAAPQQQPHVPAAAGGEQTAAPRRPLHMGPPVPDATGGVVRSLADRGPAGAPQPAARQTARPAAGPENPDAPVAAAQVAPLPVPELPAQSQPTAVPPTDDAPAAAQPQAVSVQPFPEPPAAAAYPQQPAAALPTYGQQPYEGQVFAEQSYGAAGQGPLPGPQLGEIPSHAPAQVQPWGEASAQAAAVPVAEPTAVPVEPAGAETVVPEAQPPVQDGALPVEQVPAQQALVEPAQAVPAPAEQAPEQPAPVPAEDAPVAADAAAPLVEAAPEAAQEAPAETPVEAAEPDAEQPPAAEAQAEPAAAPQPAPAPDAVLPQPPVDAAVVQEAAEAEVQPPAAEQAVDEQQAVAPDAAAQPETAGEPPAAEPVPVPVPAEPAQAPQDANPPAEQQPVEQSVADDASEEAVVVAEAPVVDEAPQPVADEAPAAPAEAPAPAEQPEPVAAQAAEPPSPEDAPAAEAEPAPAEAQTTPEAADAPEAAPAPEEAAQQPVIEAPQDAAAPQPAAPEVAEGQQPAVADAAPQPVAEGEQPVDAPEPAAAQVEVPAQPPADAPTAPEPQPATVETPAQATAEPTPIEAAQQPVADQAPQAAAPADADPTQADPADAPVTAETAVAAEADGAAEARPHAQDDAQFVEHAEGDAAHPADAPAAEPVPTTPPAPGYDDSERAAVHRVIRERRDIRNGFRSDPIPNEVLLRVLEAAHTAPSVGHSQPWDFVVIRSDDTRAKMHELAMRQREAYAQSLPKARAKQFRELKIEAILETPVNIVVTADPTRGGRHTLGRHTQPQMAPYSSALAVENLWLAARAEGLGVGWVSFFDEREMVRELGLPEHLEVVAYLCVGYVDEFPDEPELLQAGWSKRRPLSWVVHEETYGRRALPGADPHDLLQETLAGIRPLDAKALGEAWERQKRMTKPAGALGMLEIISAQLSGLSRQCPPPIPEPAAVAIFAGDHGVHAQGVTPWPQEVTGQMVANFLGGGAVCNAFANQVGAEVCVVDVGVASDLPATPGLLPRKVRPGTADFTQGPAMTQEDVLKAIEVGIETARDLVAAGNKALLTGEMGIANTTASAALIAVYTGVDPAEVTGRGTGINDETHVRKVDVVRRALELHQPDPADPIGVLAALGGLEHAAMIGLILGGASLRTPVILDGVSAGAAALVARAIAPEALAACIAGHRSAEPGHVAALNKLGLRPLVDLDLRLGEGTGALLALPVVQSAARAMHEVATFDAAGVTEKG